MRIADRLALHGAQAETLRGVVGRLLEAAVVEHQRFGLAVLEEQLAVVGAGQAVMQDAVEAGRDRGRRGRQARGYRSCGAIRGVSPLHRLAQSASASPRDRDAPETSMNSPRLDPAAFVAAIDAKAERIETPCGDGTMVFRRWGSGPPLLLLHGGHGAWSHWVRNVLPLAEHFTVLAADMPGYADSADLPRPHSPEGMAAIIAAGHADDSRRCAVLDYAASRSAARSAPMWRSNAARRSRRLVMVGTGGLGLPRPTIEPMSNWKKMGDPAERLAAHRKNLGILMLHDPGNIDALALHLQSTNTARTRINSRVDLAHRHGAARARRRHRADRRRCGAFTTRPRRKRAVISRRARELLRTFDPEAEIIRIDAGHWVQYEAPDAFNHELTGSLEAETDAFVISRRAILAGIAGLALRSRLRAKSSAAFETASRQFAETSPSRPMPPLRLRALDGTHARPRRRIGRRHVDQLLGDVVSRPASTNCRCLQRLHASKQWRARDRHLGRSRRRPRARRRAISQKLKCHASCRSISIPMAMLRTRIAENARGAPFALYGMPISYHRRSATAASSDIFPARPIG